MSVCNQDSSLVYSVMNCHWDRFMFMYQYMRCQSLSMWWFMALVSTDVKISTLQLSCRKAAGRFHHETLDIFEEINKQNKVIEMFFEMETNQGDRLHLGWPGNSKSHSKVLPEETLPQPQFSTHSKMLV